jgi:CP family cyanate transporter-like MFS transporter
MDPVTAPTVTRAPVGRVVPVGLVVVGLVIAGFAGRPVVTSTSAELPSVVAALRASGALTGLVSALPPLVFAVGSFLAPLAISRLGVARALAAAGGTAAVGLLLRVAVVDLPVFLVGTVVALAGVALANVALPTAVKRFLPGRTGAGTAAYTLMLAAGTAVAAAVTVPLGALLGGWRVGLGMWAATALLAALPWLAVAGRERPPLVPAAAAATPATAPGPAAAGPATFGVAQVARSRLGRAVAIVFAGQASSSYVMFAYLPSIAVDDGVSRAAAGLLLGWFSLLGVVSSAVPLLAGRLRDQRLLIAGLAACWVVGDLGLAFAPRSAWVWTTAAGLGSALFTLALTLIPLRSATVAGSAALSAFAQGVAYLVSAVVVFAAGIVRGRTGSFDPVLVGLAVLMGPVTLAGLRAGRPGAVEDAGR